MNRTLLLASILMFCVSPILNASEDGFADLLQADKLFQATLFEEARERYQALLDQVAAGPLAFKIRARLVENLYFLKEYKEALKYAKEANFATQQSDSLLESARLKGLYFQALALTKTGQEKEASFAFENYLKTATETAEQLDEVRLELGQISPDPAPLYEAIKWHPKKPSLYFQAQLNLAKLDIRKKQWHEALNRLAKIDQKMAPDHDLRSEHAFLSGLIFLHLHHFPQAISWLEKTDQPEALYHLGWAYLMNRSFQNAEESFQKLISHPTLKPKALLALAQCYISQSQPQKAERLLAAHSFSGEESADLLLLKGCIQPTYRERENSYRELTEGPYENSAVYLDGWYERGLNAFKDQMSENASHDSLSIAEKALQRAFELLQNRDDLRAPTILYLTGQLQLRQGKSKEAEEKFLKLVQDYPKSPIVAESLIFAAKCSEGEKARDYLRQVFENYPKSPCAAEAYFIYYPYRDYVQGERSAIKHLQNMRTLFPESPYLIPAYTLIGMDEKRDRKNSQGKWIRKKNMIAAIDSFQQAETLFDQLDSQLKEEERSFYLQIRTRATLERALANLNVAEESQGAKRRIYLQYAADVFEQMRRDLKEGELEECNYWLAQTYLKAEEDSKAETVLKEMSGKYTPNSSGYYPSRIWYERGGIAMRRQEYAQALQFFTQAEKTAKQNQSLCISADQKIDLWIQQSLCYRELNEFDQAMLLLSQAINDDTISSERVKAMYLRADIYALQGRHDLARKQLVATAKKGGEWALKAKKRLNHDNF